MWISIKTHLSEYQMIKIWKSDRKELQEVELRTPHNPEKQGPEVDRGHQGWDADKGLAFYSRKDEGLWVY